MKTTIQEFFDTLISTQTLTIALSVGFILILGFTIVRLLLKIIRRFSRKGMPPRSAIILENLIKYGGYTVILLIASKKAGIDISALLGAAGIAGIALGFAAQTSVANVISGLFLFSEHAFKIGDVLQIDAITGVVDSVELMSIRIKTFDNRLIRVPNETLIKANIINVSHFNERRFDLWLTLPLSCNLDLVFTAIKKVQADSSFALKNPEPLLLLDAITPDGTTLLVGTWFRSDDLVLIKNQLIPAILSALTEIGVQPQAKRLEVSSIYPKPGTSLTE